MDSGLKAGSRYLTVRANYYQPLTDAKKAAVVTVERSRKWSLDVTHENTELVVHSRAISQPTGFNYIDSASVLSDATYTHHYRVRNDVFTYFEELTPSWDVEASMLIPRLDRYTDLRLIAGLYGMSSGEYSSANNGWRAGLEWRPVPSLALLASYNEDSSSDRGQWFAGFRVEIPLGQTSKQLTQRRTRQLVERLLEPTGHFAGGRLMHGVTVDKQLLLYDVTTTAPYIARGKIHGEYIYLPDGRIYKILADGSLGPELRSTTDSEGSPFILIVVPEPSRATLLILGGLGLLFWRRRTGQ
jgi:Inverse autotransporter, beta-domain